jgi:SH3-like domain-containing protein
MSSHVIKKHKSSYPNPIEFRLNDQLEIGAGDIEYPGWFWVRTPDGNEGWAPKKSIEFVGGPKRGVARSDYCARELDVTVEERLQIKNTFCGWHYVINAQGESGWVPQECVQSA